MTGLNTDALNRTIFISDNLPFLKQLDTGSVDLVVIDPPFGRQQTFEGKLKPALTDDELGHEFDLLSAWGIQDEGQAYEAGLEFPDQTGQTAKFRDIWDFRYQVTQEQWDLLNDRAPSALHLIETIRHVHSDERAAYITFMAMRLLEIRRVLRSSGSIYLHCDQAVSSYLRLLLDAIFGRDNFRNEIVWKRSPGRSHAEHWGNTTDTILYYSKGEPVWNDIRIRAESSSPTRVPLDAAGVRYGKSGSAWQGYNPTDIGRHWAVPRNGTLARWIETSHIDGYAAIDDSHDRLDALDRAGLISWSSNGRPAILRPPEADAGVKVNDLWTDIKLLSASSLERTGYPTQKPQELAKRIIEASSNPGDLVLDCFAGCAYVPVAAELSGRRWIGCDMSPRAWTVVRRQFEKQPDLRIVTEGARTAESMEPRLEHHDRVIKVRGPNQLPDRTTAEEPVSPSFLTTDPPVFRQTALETSQAIWEAFVAYWGAECWYCGAPRARDRRELQLDHIEPNARDGSNDDCWNRALACSPCNGDKGSRLTPEELIKLALVKQRIETEALMREQLQAFQTRHEWARNRWETQVKPQHEQGELALA